VATTANNGRPAKPRALKLVSGRSEGKDSAGRVIPEAPNFPRGIPEKPAELSVDANWLWDKVIEQMAGPGLLKPLDAPSLEVVCETFARWREAVRFRQEKALLGKNSQGVVAAPWIGIEERASREFRAWCAEYGLTPAAEKNLASGDGNNDGTNPFA
jgi:P27 family predicted phage terminase small subunit